MLKKVFHKSDFVKNSFILILGTSIAQIIPVLLQFPLRKIYTPEEFGTFAVYMGVVSVLASISNLKYAGTIVIPKDDDDGLNLLVGTIVLNFLFSIIVFICLFFFSDFIINQFHFPQTIKKWLFLLPISIFLVSGHLSFSYWLTRKKIFKGLAVNKILRRGTEGIAQFSIGKNGNSGGLIIGSLIGDVFNFGYYIIQVKNSVTSFNSVNIRQIKNQFKKFSDFPKYSLIPSFLDTFSLTLPVFIITGFYSEEITGQYDLTVKMLSVPLALISLAISQVLVQKVAEYKHTKKKVLPLIRNNFLILGLAGLLGGLIIYFLGEKIFTFAFGDNWLMAGKLSTILVFSFSMRFAISPLSSIFVALEKIKVSSVWQVCYFLLILSLFLLKNISIEKFIFYYMVMDIFAYSVYGLLIYLVAKNHDKNKSIHG